MSGVKKITIKKIAVQISGWLCLLSHFNSIKTSTFIDLNWLQHIQQAGLESLGNLGSPLFGWGCQEDFARVLLHLLEKEDKRITPPLCFIDFSPRGFPERAQLEVVP